MIIWYIHSASGSPGSRRKLDAVGPNVVVQTGYVAPEDLPALYAGAEALLFWSLVEGFGLPALEAMALGVPVVASKAGALPEVVGGAGMLVDPRDVAGLARALEQVCTDAALALRLRDEGIARAQRFSWPASARALVDAYAEARRRGASRRASPRGSRA